jgi:hypothetical protein
MKIKISNITYDEGHAGLPTELVITLDDGLDDEEIEHEASEFISSETGFCHQGFTLEKIV